MRMLAIWKCTYTAEEVRMEGAIRKELFRQDLQVIASVPSRANSVADDFCIELQARANKQRWEGFVEYRRIKRF